MAAEHQAKKKAPLDLENWKLTVHKVRGVYTWPCGVYSVIFILYTGGEI